MFFRPFHSFFFLLLWLGNFNWSVSLILRLVQVWCWRSLLNFSIQSLYPSAPKFSFSDFLFLYVHLVLILFSRYHSIICSLIALQASLDNYFKFFIKKFLGLHFFRAGYLRFTGFLWWRHISLILCDVNHLFVCLLAICISRRNISLSL